MKTKKGFIATDFSLLVTALLLVSLVVFSSCGETNEPDAIKSETAPPPPPPVPVNPDSVYVLVDQLPVFTGGDSLILKYIAENTVYPEGARINKIQGKVIVRLIVNKDCTVSDVEVLKGVNPLLNAEAVRVVSSLPKFETPGIKDGAAVRVHFMIPIYFTLK